MHDHAHPSLTAGNRHERRAIVISLAVGLFIVTAKVTAYAVSGSLAVLSDMLESLVHNLAVLFAAYCVWVSQKPPDDNHLYGHGKAQFLSAGVEGALVTGAGLVILFESVMGIVHGYQLRDAGTGLALMAAAGAVNAVLGWYLVRVGRREKSIILVANGKHVLSDTVTTVVALGGLGGAALTGWLWVDFGVALLGGFYIIHEGVKILRTSLAGLLDEADSEVDRVVRDVLDRESNRRGWDYHELRHRSEGNKHWIELHLIFREKTLLREAHDEASRLEAELRGAFDEPVTITTHLEPESHRHHHDPKRPHGH